MKFFKLEKKNNIAIISFTRAKSLNALNQSTLKELIDLNRTIKSDTAIKAVIYRAEGCLLYTSPSPRDLSSSRMPSSA